MCARVPGAPEGRPTYLQKSFRMICLLASFTKKFATIVLLYHLSKNREEVGDSPPSLNRNPYMTTRHAVTLAHEIKAEGDASSSGRWIVVVTSTPSHANSLATARPTIGTQRFLVFSLSSLELSEVGSKAFSVLYTVYRTAVRVPC